MAGIRQLQRRAIESLIDFVEPIVIRRGQRFFLDGREIFFRGISVGVGTCSDLRGIDFAVFSRESDDAPPLSLRPLTVRGAIWLRTAGNSEKTNSFTVSKSQLVLVVEALNWQIKNKQTIIFTKTGKKRSYIPILS